MVELKKENLILVPKSEWENSKTGMQVVLDGWWIITPNDELVYYTKDRGRYVSPQFNVNQVVSDRILKSIKYPVDVELRKIAIVYNYPRDESAYWRKKYEEWNAAVL